MEAKAYGTGHTVVLYTDCVVGAVSSHVPARPAAIGRASVISGELRAGGNSICLCSTGVLLLPPRRPPWTACVHFRDLSPSEVFHLNFKFLCLLGL